MKVLAIAFAIINFAAGCIGWAIIFSLMLGFGNASVKGPWGEWVIHASNSSPSQGGERR